MSDPDQPGEGLDEEHLAGEYPPDRPLQADARGATGQEQLGGESLAQREERTEPEVWEQPPAGRTPEAAAPVIEDVPHTPDGPEVELPVDEADKTGPLAPDDEISGDETTRETAPDRAPRPTEETAVHTEPEDGRG